MHHLPKPTVHAAFYAPVTPRVPQHQRCALINGEERQIVDLLGQFADRGAPLTRSHVEEAVMMFITRMTVSRRITLPFKNGRPGRKFFRSFMKRHKDTLSFIRPLRQEHERFKAINADTLCKHFVTLECLIKEYNLDATRIWNLDECGVTPGRDANGRSQKKRILRSNGSRDVKIMQFSYENRVTFMPPISAVGEVGPCLFVFKGKRMPYRRVLKDGVEFVDTIANHLTRKAVITMREEGGGVDRDNFLEWAWHSVDSIRDLTRGGRKVLLIYDGYRSHMSLEVLRLFKDSGVVVYALPAHSSGKTQPLDVVAFSSFKRRLNQLLYETNEKFCDTPCTVYELCDLMTAAYNDTFYPKIIQSSFSRSGIWPLNPEKPMNVPRPADSTLTTVLTVQQMRDLLELRRREIARLVFGSDVQLLDSGFVDTTKGAVLTTEAAIDAVQKRAAAVQREKAKKAVEQSRRAIKAAQREEKERAIATRRRELAIQRQANLAKMDVEAFKRQMRSIKERRAHARMRVVAKRATGPFTM